VDKGRWGRAGVSQRLSVYAIIGKNQGVRDMLVKIETYFDGEFWCARGIGEDIFTQGKTLDELYQNIKEAVSAHYGEIDEPVTILTLSEVKLADAKATSS
jgi:predicted RNase H-like HicB family nuclease